MKKILLLIPMLTLAGVVFAQSSSHSKMADTAYKNPSRAQASSTVDEGSNGKRPPARTQKLGNAPIQQRNVETSQQTGNPASVNDNNGNRKICRTIGTTVYYCL